MDEDSCHLMMMLDKVYDDVVEDELRPEWSGEVMRALQTQMDYRFAFVKHDVLEVLHEQLEWERKKVRNEIH